MVINNDNESDPKKIAEGFNAFFSSIAEKLQENIHSVNTDYKKYLSDRVDSNFLMHGAETEEIMRITLSLNNLVLIVSPQIFLNFLTQISVFP